MAIIFLKEADRGNPFLADKPSFDISNNWFSHLIPLCWTVLFEVDMFGNSSLYTTIFLQEDFL